MKKSKDIWDPTVEVEKSPYIHEGNTTEIYIRPTLIDLFCGCGGISYGFEKAGFNVLLGIDHYRPAIKTFQSNHRAANTILVDIRQISNSQIQKVIADVKVTVIAAGVPCQGFSRCNRKKNHTDKRNFLFKEFIRVIDFFYPDYVLLENVAGMREALGGAIIEEIEKRMRCAGKGYHVESCMLNALHYGVPQSRNRLFYIGASKESGLPIQFPKLTHDNGLKPALTVRDAISDLPRLTRGKTKTMYEKEPTCDYQKTMRDNGPNLLNHTAPIHPKSTVMKIEKTKSGEPMYSNFKQRVRLSWDLPSPTQVSGGIRPQFQFGHPDQPRGLTVRERCRIQSFPDSFVVEGGTVQGRVQTGNAVPPLLARAIAKEMMRAITQKNEVKV